MISVDTNVIVRLLTKDDVGQFQQDLKLFQEREIFKRYLSVIDLFGLLVFLIITL